MQVNIAVLGDGTWMWTAIVQLHRLRMLRFSFELHFQLLGARTDGIKGLNPQSLPETQPAQPHALC